MEVEKYMNGNQNLSYLELKEKLCKEYKLKIYEDIKNNYYMITTTNDCDFTNPFIRNCTGIILEKNTNCILYYFGDKGYDFCNKYNNNNIDFKNIEINKCYISEYLDGYIIKVFYYNREWRFSTSKHTDIKCFKVHEKNKILYDIFKKEIIKFFDTFDDFLFSLDNNYCYTFILNNDKINILNKINLKKFKEEFNFNKYIPFCKYEINNYKYNESKKYILVERNGKNIIKKIHIFMKDIEKLLLI